MKNIIGTLILSPASHIVACDEGALKLFRCAPEDLFDLPIAAILPELPMKDQLPSENIRYACQFGDLISWKAYRGRAPNGRSIPVDLLLGRCGLRPSAALCLFLRRPLDLAERNGRVAQATQASSGAPHAMIVARPKPVTVIYS